MRKDQLRVAVVGLGFGAELAPFYLTHPDVKSVVICDSNPDRLGGVGSKFGIEKQFKDVEEVIQSENIDAVHLASGIPDHARQSVSVLKSDKHCACSVPMATSIADIQAVIAASRESRCNYMMM